MSKTESGLERSLPILKRPRVFARCPDTVMAVLAQGAFHQPACRRWSVPSSSDAIKPSKILQNQTNLSSAADRLPESIALFRRFWSVAKTIRSLSSVCWRRPAVVLRQSRGCRQRNLRQERVPCKGRPNSGESLLAMKAVVSFQDADLAGQFGAATSASEGRRRWLKPTICWAAS